MKRPQEFLSFITEVARGHTRRKELKKKINLTSPHYYHSLDGFLEKSGSFYKLKDPLFRIWLLYAYRPNLMGLKFNLDSRADSLFEEVKNLGYNLNILKSEPFHKKEFADFIQSLFLNFNNEFIVVEGRRKLLPGFSKIEEISATDDYLILQGIKKDKGIWLIVIFLSPIREEIAYKLLTDLRNKFADFNQKIAISTLDVEENSKSILKAKGFWFWDLEFLNELRQIYGLSGNLHA